MNAAVVAYILSKLQTAGVAPSDLKAKVDAFIAETKAKLPPELQGSFNVSTDAVYAQVAAQLTPANLQAIAASIIPDLVTLLTTHQGPFDDEPLGLA